MKRIEKEITRIEKVVEFESFDGRIWKNEEDCKKWEQSYEASVIKMWNKIPKLDKCAGEYVSGWAYDDILYIVKVRDEEDVKVINAWLDCFTDNGKTVEFNTIGKEILIVYCDYDNSGNYFCTIDEYLETEKNIFDKIKEELNSKN